MSERRGLKTILAFAVSLLALSSAYAQPKSLGASFSFSGFGLVYDHALKNDMSFMEVSLKAESAEGFLGRSVYPGIWSSGNGSLVKAIRSGCLPVRESLPGTARTIRAWMALSSA